MSASNPSARRNAQKSFQPQPYRSLVCLAALLGLSAAELSCGEKASFQSGTSTGGSSSTASGGAPGAGGTAASGGTAPASGGSVAASGGATPMAGGGPSVGGVSTSGGNANASSGGTGGTETTEPVGTPYVFVGSTEGMVRAFVMSPTDGSLTPAGSQAADKLDFMTVDQVNKVVFVSGNDKVSAYKYDRMEETFTLIDSKASTQGTHVAVHPSGKYVFVAGYDPGEMFLHTFSEQAGFGEGQAFSPGRNAHEVRCSASGTAIYVPCLGSDHVAQYTFNPTSGVLTPNGTAVLADQSGPRHMDFHPTANVAYVLSELSSEVYVFNINLGTGALEARPADTVFTHTDARFRWSSDIRVTADGAYVYAVNRQPSEIVRFKVETTHALTRLGADALSAEVRAFGVDGAGKYLQVGAKNGTLVALRIDPQTGALTQSASRDGLGTINVTEVHYLK